MRHWGVVLIVSAAVPLTAQSELTKLLRGVENRYNRPRTMQMHFEQSLTGQGRMGRTETGTLYLQKPGRMRWDYREPEGKLFLADSEYIWYYSPNSGRVEREQMKESADYRAPLAFLMGRLDFQRDFREFRTRPEGADLYIVAKPKSERAPYETVEFLVTPEHRIRLLKVIGQDRSTMTLRLTGEIINPRLDASLFRFKVPAGVELVDVEEPPGQPQ